MTNFASPEEFMAAAKNNPVFQNVYGKPPGRQGSSGRQGPNRQESKGRQDAQGHQDAQGPSGKFRHASSQSGGNVKFDDAAAANANAHAHAANARNAPAGEFDYGFDFSQDAHVAGHVGGGERAGGRGSQGHGGHAHGGGDSLSGGGGTGGVGKSLGGAGTEKDVTKGGNLNPHASFNPAHASFNPAQASNPQVARPSGGTILQPHVYVRPSSKDPSSKAGPSNIESSKYSPSKNDDAKDQKEVTKKEGKEGMSPVSASEKMSAITHDSKLKAVLQNEIPALKEDFKGEVTKLMGHVERLFEVVEMAVAMPVTREPSKDAVAGPAATVKSGGAGGHVGGQGGDHGGQGGDHGGRAETAGEEVGKGKGKMTLSQHLAQANQAQTPLIPTQAPYILTLPRYETSVLAMKPVPLGNMVTFPLSFLKKTLGGDEWAPGLYYPAHSLTEMVTDKNEELRTGSKSSKVKFRLEKETWYALDAETNPYVPKRPGDHGAALTPLCNDLPDLDYEGDMDPRFINVPVFVALPDHPSNDDDEDDGEDIAPPTHGVASTKETPKEQNEATGEKQYVYMGMYTQPRYSDKLSASETQLYVPPKVLHHWARIIASERLRPEWMDEPLLELLETRPAFEMPTLDDPTADTAKKRIAMAEALSSFEGEMASWRDHNTRVLEKLTPAKVLKWFTDPDAGVHPGFRLWWEYLKCTSFDKGFYECLATRLRADPEISSTGGTAGGTQDDDDDDDGDGDDETPRAEEYHGENTTMGGKSGVNKSGHGGAGAGAGPGAGASLGGSTGYSYDGGRSPQNRRHRRRHPRHVQDWEAGFREVDIALSAASLQQTIPAVEQNNPTHAQPTPTHTLKNSGYNPLGYASKLSLKHQNGPNAWQTSPQTYQQSPQPSQTNPQTYQQSPQTYKTTPRPSQESANTYGALNPPSATNPQANQWKPVFSLDNIKGF
ncbi:MAG: hypothetical protein Q9162_005883, partial [Coniocarpon cinnabarinum]